MSRDVTGRGLTAAKASRGEEKFIPNWIGSQLVEKGIPEPRSAGSRRGFQFGKLGDPLLSPGSLLDTQPCGSDCRHTLKTEELARSSEEIHNFVFWGRAHLAQDDSVFLALFIYL